ncbi:hypothetical protein Taro_004617 [Colocasia esculenta]|uniref:Uncharacterized protein n=1 Tax=Colocasia esculenta TaxID=4460 RepID=A0A843TMT0_COLES|nr:hypothetical protein [Colocasia esculenta]
MHANPRCSKHRETRACNHGSSPYLLKPDRNLLGPSRRLAATSSLSCHVHAATTPRRALRLPLLRFQLAAGRRMEWERVGERGLPEVGEKRGLGHFWNRATI